MNAQQEAMNNRLRDAAEQIAETLQKTTELLQEAKQPLIQRHEELCQAYADAEDRVQAAPAGSTEQRYAEAERDLYNAWIARVKDALGEIRCAQHRMEIYASNATRDTEMLPERVAEAGK